MSLHRRRKKQLNDKRGPDFDSLEYQDLLKLASERGLLDGGVSRKREDVIERLKEQQ